MPFGRKNRERTPAAEDAQPVSAPAQRSGKKRKPQELLSSVVNESAIGAAIDALKNNEPFALPNDAGWVGLLLSVDEIGGLSQKQKGDATKGSIIELIASDAIQVIATKPMLESEFLGFIPTPATLERMDEYSLLTEAPYHFVVFHSTDGGNSLGVDTPRDSETTFAVAQAIANGDTSVATVLPEVWSHFGGSEATAAPAALGSESEFDRVLVGANVGAAAANADEADPMAGFSYTPDAPEASVAEAPSEPVLDYGDLANDGFDPAAGEDTSFEFDEVAFAASLSQEAPTSPVLPDLDGASAFDAEWQDELADAAAAQASDAAAAAGDEEDGYFKYVRDNKERVVDEEEVRDTIARRFLSTDLDLVVDTAEFDKVFNTAAEAITIETPTDSTDWLGSQAAQLSRQANAELQTLHQFHQDELRELFVEVMAKHIEKTNADVSTDAPGSQYYDLMNGAKQDFETQRAAAPQQVAEARESIIERFNAAANSRAEQAAAHARAQYEDKNRPKLDRDLAEAGAEIDRRIEEQYAHDRTTVLDLRRKDANLLMDIGTNRVFEYLREVQDGQRKAERELLENWNGRLVAFIDENRKDDLARAMVLADQLARQNEVDALKAEHKTALRDLRREHAEREQVLAQERERIRQDAIAELAARRTEWHASVEVEKSQRAAGGALVEQLQMQIGTLSERYEQQYEGQIATLKADRDAITLELDRQHASHKRGLYLLIALGVVLVVAAVAVGIIAGWSWGHNQAVTTTPAASAAIGSLLP